MHECIMNNFDIYIHKVINTSDSSIYVNFEVLYLLYGIIMKLINNYCRSKLLD